MNMINQEDGTIPGPALSALETVITEGRDALTRSLRAQKKDA